MSDYNLPQEEGVGIIAVWLYEYGLKGVNMNDPGNSPSKIADRWLAEQLRQAQEEAWDFCAGVIATKEQHPEIARTYQGINPYRSES